VQAAVTRFAAAFGTDVRLMVTYEALLLTAVADGQFRTKISLRVPSFNVNLAVVAAANSLVGPVRDRDGHRSPVGRVGSQGKRGDGGAAASVIEFL